MEMGGGPAQEESTILDRDHAAGWAATCHGYLGIVDGWLALF